MYKSLFRVCLGSWWLLVGINASKLPFGFNEQEFEDFREYSIRLLWLELTFTRLPF